MYSTLSVKDKLSMIGALESVRIGYGALSAVQEEGPAQQVAALATVFNTMCKVLGLDAGEELHRNERVVRTAHELNIPEVRALEEFIKNELKVKLL